MYLSIQAQMEMEPWSVVCQNLSLKFVGVTFNDTTSYWQVVKYPLVSSAYRENINFLFPVPVNLK